VLDVLTNIVIPVAFNGRLDLVWGTTVFLTFGVSSVFGVIFVKIGQIYKINQIAFGALGLSGVGMVLGNVIGVQTKRNWPVTKKPQASVSDAIIKMNNPTTISAIVEEENNDLEFDFESSPIRFKGEEHIDGKDGLEVLPAYVSRFDQLVDDKGLERGSTLLVSGGAGTGKTTFSLQSIYYGALKGEKGIYLSFEEQPSKIKAHMKKNYGWDFEELEKKGLVAVVRIDPSKIAKSIEQSMLEKEGGLKIALKTIELPFVPDRIVVDSLSALSIAFEKEETYRKYLRELFEALEASKAVSFVLSETEQNPKVYSRTGVEEFLADGVIVLYNMKKDGKRENALEILKLRSSRHKKGLIPYTFSKNGLDIMPKQQ
jgi:KaiC/GvpD/RAD55 family RecA-like ATPase